MELRQPETGRAGGGFQPAPGSRLRRCISGSHIEGCKFAMGQIIPAEEFSARFVWIRGKKCANKEPTCCKDKVNSVTGRRAAEVACSKVLSHLTSPAGTASFYRDTSHQKGSCGFSVCLVEH